MKRGGAKSPDAENRAPAMTGLAFNGAIKDVKQPSVNKIDRCWAQKTDGTPCLRPSCDAKGHGIPYCQHCMDQGDAAVMVVDHDLRPDVFGKILVAAQDLPKGYKLVYWGRLLRTKAVRVAALDHVIEFVPDSVRGMIDPTPHPSSVAQFAMMPGNDELVNLVCTEFHFGKYGKERSALAARVYKLTKDVPKGHQITHYYGADWMRSRGIVRQSVGTARYPVEKKRRILQRESI